MKQVLFIALLAGCLAGFAGNEAACTVPKDDKAAIESFSIQNMVEPKVGKRNQEGREAFETVRKLVTAINAHDMGSARELLSFKDAADFEKELSSRGLAWIKEMIENKVTILFMRACNMRVLKLIY